MKNVFSFVVFVMLIVTSSAFGMDTESLPGKEAIDKFLEVITSGTTIMIVAAVAEFGLRFIKSEKAMSLIYIASGMFSMIGNLFTKIGKFLDKVLPQRIK